MLNFLTANISPDGLRDHNAEKSHVLKPYGIVGHAASASLQGTCGSILQRRPLSLASTACSTIAQLRNRLIQDVRNPDENPDGLHNSPKKEKRAYKEG